jgi:putative ABC transport system ATP-binding protein
MIAVRGVTKTYGRGDAMVHALAGVDLDVRAGEFVSIVGPSGSGKSTLLHLLGGLDVPSAGSVAIDGTDISHLSDDDVTIFRRRAIGFVFQFFNLMPTLSAAENVALPLLLDGKRGATVDTRVAAALDAVGLGHRRSHRPDQLSGGEVQRVAIARALVIEPKLILADEPTGNLDSATGDHVLALLARANQDRGATIAMVTHDAKAAAHGTRVVTMRDGRVVDDVPAR